MRFDFPYPFFHANGSVIHILGNDKDGFAITFFEKNAHSQLPKGVLDIIVPCFEDYDHEITDRGYSSSIMASNDSKEEKQKKLDLAENEFKKKTQIENGDNNHQIGLTLNDFEYRALWTLNSFIREYFRITGVGNSHGLSIPQFKDGLHLAICKNLDDPKNFISSYQLNFNNRKLDDSLKSDLSNAMLSSQVLSISDYVRFHLNILNYSFATIGMYQEFENMWEIYSPNKDDKWRFIEHVVSSRLTKANLAEMINARNNIVHNKQLKTAHSSRNRLKTDWGARPMDEYEIFAMKQAWGWHTSLVQFSKEFHLLYPQS